MKLMIKISCESPIIEALSIGFFGGTLPLPLGNQWKKKSFLFQWKVRLQILLILPPLWIKLWKGASTHPITPNLDVLAPSYLKESFEIFKQRYPPSSFFVGRSPPAFCRGRAFSISEVELRDDWAEQKYRETFPGKFPLCPLGNGRN